MNLGRNQILEVDLTTARHAQTKAAGTALYQTGEPARPPENDACATIGVRL